MDVSFEHNVSHPVAGIIFDLDGTLTKPYFDFDVIRREIGLPTEPRTPVLEALETMGPQDRARAEAILLEHERRAAEESELWDDAHDVLGEIRRRALPMALLTRNSRRSADVVLARHDLQFDAVYTRESGPVKPSPQPVLDLCRALGTTPARTWMVGDYLFDIQSGRAAGSPTILMIGDASPPPFAGQADHVIRRLAELVGLIDEAAAGGNRLIR